MSRGVEKLRDDPSGRDSCVRVAEVVHDWAGGTLLNRLTAPNHPSNFVIGSLSVQESG